MSEEEQLLSAMTTRSLSLQQALQDCAWSAQDGFLVATFWKFPMLVQSTFPLTL